MFGFGIEESSTTVSLKSSFLFWYSLLFVRMVPRPIIVIIFGSRFFIFACDKILWFLDLFFGLLHLNWTLGYVGFELDYSILEFCQYICYSIDFVWYLVSRFWMTCYLKTSFGVFELFWTRIWIVNLDCNSYYISGSLELLSSIIFGEFELEFVRQVIY